MAQFAPDHFEEFAPPVLLPLPKVAGGEGELEKKNKAGKCKEPKKVGKQPQYFLYYHRTSQPSLNAKGICWLNFPPDTGQVYNSSHIQKGDDNLTLSTLAVCFLKPWLTSAVQVSGKYLTFLANPSWSKEIRKREVRRQATT